MKPVGLVILTLLLACVPAGAGPYQDAAAEVRRAHAAGDQAALKRLANLPAVSAWRLAEIVAVEGSLDGAEALAKYVPDPEALAAYLATVRVSGPPRELRAGLIAAMGAGDPAAQLEMLLKLDAKGAFLTSYDVLTTRGQTQRRLGRIAESAASYAEAVAKARAIGWEPGELGALYSAGRINAMLGKWRESARFLRGVLALAQRRKDTAAVAGALTNLSIVYHRQGRLAKGLAMLKRSLALKQRVGDALGAAVARANIGTFSLEMADYAQALFHLEQALAYFVKAKQLAEVSGVLMNLANTWSALGDGPKAADFLTRALKLLEKHGAPNDYATALVNLGTLQMNHGAHAEAERSYREAIQVFEQAGAALSALEVRGSLAALLQASGRIDEALGMLESVITQAESGGRPSSLPALLLQLASALEAAGREAEATRVYTRAEQAAHRMRLARTEVRAIVARGRRHYAAGAYAPALDAAGDALEILERMLGGLGERSAAATRSEYMRVFGIGTLSAARLKQPDQLLRFIESGRAGALLESLGGRDAMRWAELPDGLHQMQKTARAAQARAQRAYVEAIKAGSRKQSKAAATALDAAQAQVEEAVARIQREAKRQAGLLYPRPTTLDELQSTLLPSEAMVAFALHDGELVRFVVTSEGTQVLPLITWRVLKSHLGRVDCADQDTDPKPHVTSLRQLLTGGMKLGPGVTTVLVSPAGPLCYVPFHLIFDQTVVMIPSGTTLVRLREDALDGGVGVLGIGAPDYAGTSAGSRSAYFRGRPLSPLPATKAELDAVADTVLVGKDATETGFAEAVAKRDRWRAVHFACHGLMDAKHPGRSALALTQTETEDGFLTGLEVFQAVIPADLVVLSACDTARGQVVAGEGLVGMTRAFMYAGAPRVICSLWKVDDAATSALMQKFYALWNPKAKAAERPTVAEALLAAQKHIAAQEKWSHPYYWAAWQVWGLP